MTYEALAALCRDMADTPIRVNLTEEQKRQIEESLRRAKRHTDEARRINRRGPREA